MLTAETPIISFQGVSKKYPPNHLVMSDVNLEIEKGELVFLTGQSGAGKTTLLRLLFRAELPTSGKIVVDGMDLSSLSRSQVPYLRRKIGVIFQDFKLLSNKSVFENVALSLEVLGLRKEQVKKRVCQVLEGVGLGHKMHQYPPQLSGGEQQRVSIARAVVNRPPIILADEPTGNLDKLRTAEVMLLMHELNARGATILFATHDERLYQDSPGRVLRLESGKVEVVS